MANIEVRIEIDSEKLMQDYPQGGSIDPDGIIKMYDGKNNISEGELVTYVDPKDTVEWTIETNGFDIGYVQCTKKDENWDSWFTGPSVIDPRNQQTCNATVKDELPNGNAVILDYSICIKNNAYEWHWDPSIERRRNNPPKV